MGNQCCASCRETPDEESKRLAQEANKLKERGIEDSQTRTPDKNQDDAQIGEEEEIVLQPPVPEKMPEEMKNKKKNGKTKQDWSASLLEDEDSMAATADNTLSNLSPSKRNKGALIALGGNYYLLAAVNKGYSIGHL